MIPEEFKNRMKHMLGEEYEAFLSCYERPEYRALRLNTQKAEKERFLGRMPFPLTPVPWNENGFYYDRTDAPGKHPYHEAGVYYIQEPSAMAPAKYLEAEPGERILDLCAAPGGKSTQIAADMKGSGLLFCNEIHPARAKILSENIERMGMIHAVVTNETPERLSEHFFDYFDRILVDAPCSGEGMFRKNEESLSEWSKENITLCAARQDRILHCAASMLKPGGRLVYSTCTFAPEENEGSILRFLVSHPEFDTVCAPVFAGMENGSADWYTQASPDADVSDRLKDCVNRTIRLWPHKLNGEGHFVAVLEKKGSLPEMCGSCLNPPMKGLSKKECAEYIRFLNEELRIPLNGGLLRFGDQLYQFPDGMPSLKGLKVLRPGLHLGTMKKNRFEPSHALALALRCEDAAHSVRLAPDGEEIRRYLSGQTINLLGEKGWYLVAVDEYSIGWGKLSGGVLKNHYPKGKRRQI